MFARIRYYPGIPENFSDQGVGATLKEQPGFQAWYALIDKANNTRVTITFWDTEEHMSASGGKTVAQLGGALPEGSTTETFEVVDQA